VARRDLGPVVHIFSHIRQARCAPRARAAAFRFSLFLRRGWRQAAAQRAAQRPPSARPQTLNP